MARFLTSATGTSSSSRLLNHSFERGLNSRPTAPLGVLSPHKNHAILCVGVACASLSLLAALISLRWFLLMRRNYRHHLILFLIICDTWKSLCYFVFPLVSFTQGKVQSSSKFCQASGFFLALGLESSDFAILMVALHTILYVFKRPQIKGEGGLYPYRQYIYPLWLGFPLLSAGLAFTNTSNGYVTSGTFCYLPKRPYWYRLALSWIPRYLIFITIFVMYGVIWAHVNFALRDFKDVENSQYASESPLHSMSGKSQTRMTSENLDFSPASKDVQVEHRRGSSSSKLDPLQSEHPPWQDVSFITSKPLQNARVVEADFAPDAGSSLTETRAPSRHVSLHSTEQRPIPDSRKQSEVPTLGTNFTGESLVTESSIATTPLSGTTNHLKSTRSAVRRQLRLLFVYPLVYLLMWTFPFASHCLLYSDYYAAHPRFWLSVVTTASLSLQAGVDCLVFSWSERPWNRIGSAHGPWRSVAALFRVESHAGHASPSGAVEEPSSARDSNWWEAEGRKRKDSVWLGTDHIIRIISRQEQEEEQEEAKDSQT